MAKKTNWRLKDLLTQDMFDNASVRWAKNHKQPGVLSVSIQLPVKKEKITIPEAGHQKYLVTCDRFMIYTTIGADNQHHASNKATKLFGPHWSKCLSESHHVLFAMREYVFYPVGKFNELLKTLAI